jgi:hypothetical protein
MRTMKASSRELGALLRTVGEHPKPMELARIEVELRTLEAEALVASADSQTTAEDAAVLQRLSDEAHAARIALSLTPPRLDVAAAVPRYCMRCHQNP